MEKNDLYVLEDTEREFGFNVLSLHKIKYLLISKQLLILL